MSLELHMQGKVWLYEYTGEGGKKEEGHTENYILLCITYITQLTQFWKTSSG